MIPKNMRGDIPCHDCGTKDNPVWFTDNVFWNDIMDDDKDVILCLNCFVVRSENKYKPVSWRFIPEWRKEKR